MVAYARLLVFLLGASLCSDHFHVLEKSHLFVIVQVIATKTFCTRFWEPFITFSLFFLLESSFYIKQAQ